MNNNSTKKILIVGAVCMFAYAEFGGAGLLVAAFLLMML